MILSIDIVRLNIISRCFSVTRDVRMIFTRFSSHRTQECNDDQSNSTHSHPLSPSCRTQLKTSTFTLSHLQIDKSMDAHPTDCVRCPSSWRFHLRSNSVRQHSSTKHDHPLANVRSLVVHHQLDSRGLHHRNTHPLLERSTYFDHHRSHSMHTYM